MEERYHIVPEEGRRKGRNPGTGGKGTWMSGKGGEADTARAAGLLLDDFRVVVWDGSHWNSRTGKEVQLWGVRKARQESYGKC